MRAKLAFPAAVRPRHIHPGLRISIVGPAGSGKTTLSKALSNLGLRHIKVDKVLHGPAGRLSPERFRARLAVVAQGESWIIDGNVLIADVHTAMPEVWQRADTIVWLDFPRWVIIPRLIVRTGRRAYRRMNLPDGTRQAWDDLFVLDPARSVIAWTWFEQPHLRAEYERPTRDPRWSDRVVRLRTRRDVRAFTRTLERQARQRSHRNDNEALTGSTRPGRLLRRTTSVRHQELAADAYRDPARCRLQAAGNAEPAAAVVDGSADHSTAHGTLTYQGPTALPCGAMGTRTSDG